MKILLWIDDFRDPHKDDWLRFSPIGANCTVAWAKTYDEALEWLECNPTPDAVCFDHDLDDPLRSGYDIAKYLVCLCEQRCCALPLFASQSSNPVGRENILRYLTNATIAFKERGYK